MGKGEIEIGGICVIKRLGKKTEIKSSWWAENRESKAISESTSRDRNRTVEKEEEAYKFARKKECL